MPKGRNKMRIYIECCYCKKLAILIVTLPTVMLLALFKGALIYNFAACKNFLRTNLFANFKSTFKPSSGRRGT